MCNSDGYNLVPRIQMKLLCSRHSRAFVDSQHSRSGLGITQQDEVVVAIMLLNSCQRSTYANGVSNMAMMNHVSVHYW
jgi:hypothetical protein